MREVQDFIFESGFGGWVIKDINDNSTAFSYGHDSKPEHAREALSRPKHIKSANRKRAGDAARFNLYPDSLITNH